MFKVLNGAKIPVKVWTSDLANVESSALDQLRSVADLPWVKAVSAMPDVHWGLGATVGSVIVSQGAVSPSVVGVDIGCGMCAVRTPFTSAALGDNLKELRHSIERSVPVGHNSNKSVTERAGLAWAALGELSERGKSHAERAMHQLGTLGGGNHFIEICIDESDQVWVLLHSGSRNIGKVLAQHHIDKAKGYLKDLSKYALIYGQKEIPADLACLAESSYEYGEYLNDLFFCQRFAKANRDEMMKRVLKDLSFYVLGSDSGEAAMTTMRVDCHHNYIEHIEFEGKRSILTRKGAVSAKNNELGIIPGSMGTRSYIVRGKGNEHSFCSCSHGAGRRMSRGAAKKQFTVDDMKAQTNGVECRKDEGVLDEIPGAYKDIDEVMAAQSDLVDIVHTLKQLVCVKG